MVKQLLRLLVFDQLEHEQLTVVSNFGQVVMRHGLEASEDQSRHIRVVPDQELGEGHQELPHFDLNFVRPSQEHLLFHGLPHADLQAGLKHLHPLLNLLSLLAVSE